MNKTKIILLCVAASISYGIIHDQITARLCIEYFTVAHPPLFPTTSPTLLALYWGVAATAGLGFVLGYVLSLVAHAGNQPPLHFTQLISSVVRLLATMALSSVVAGICGYWLTKHGIIAIPRDFGAAIPRESHVQFMAVSFAHASSYLVGLLGSALLVFRVWTARGRPVAISFFPRSMGAVLRAAAIAAVTAYLLWLRFSEQR